MTNIQNIVEEFNRARSKSKDVPSCLQFSAEENSETGVKVVVCVKTTPAETGLRSVDPWMLVFIHALRTRLPDSPIKRVHVDFKFKPTAYEIESFRRRLSYLAINNGWNATIVVDEKSEDAHQIYKTIDELLVRPENEVVRKDIAGRHDNPDSDGKIEKHFQTWLAGEVRGDNERLSVLSEDFIIRNARAKVIREFPTGVFDLVISKKSRILPTYWVDLLSLNKRNELAVIELKVNDSKLNVMAQALDYALFFSCYRKQLTPFLSDLLGPSVCSTSAISCYIANNYFHPRFPEISPFYAPRSKKWPFTFRIIDLGKTSVLQRND